MDNIADHAEHDSPDRERERPSLPRRALRGALAGAIATLPMTIVMLGAQRAGLMGKLPPKKITQRMLDLGRVRRSRPADTAAATVSHVGYGTLVGALFGSLAQGRLLPKCPVSEGVLFGGAAWAASYFGWVPALGAMPPPTRDRKGRTVSMALAHAVFGAVLGALSRR